MMIEVDQVHVRATVQLLVDAKELLDGGGGAAPRDRIERPHAHAALDGR